MLKLPWISGTYDNDQIVEELDEVETLTSSSVDELWRRRYSLV